MGELKVDYLEVGILLVRGVYCLSLVGLSWKQGAKQGS